MCALWKSSINRRLFESDEGFSIEVVPKKSIIYFVYREGKRTAQMECQDSPLPGGRYLVEIRRKSIEFWETPEGRVPVGEAEKDTILENIRRAIAINGGELDVPPPEAEMHTVYLPERLAERGEHATILRWHVEERDYVREGEVLFEVSTKSGIAALPSPCGGTLMDQAVRVGDSIAAGVIVALIYVDPRQKMR
jgi:biotin carboxyl carrier protein